MAESQIESPALIGAALAAGLGLFVSQSSFGWLSTAGGLTLLLILFAYDRQGSRSGLQSFAFATVCGLAFVLAAGILLQRVIDRPSIEIWLAVAWGGATVIFTAVDRTRVSARGFPAAAAPPAGVAPVPAHVPAPVPPPVPTPAPARVPASSKSYGLGLTGPGFEFKPEPPPAPKPTVPVPPAGPEYVPEPEYAREEAFVSSPLTEPVTQAPQSSAPPVAATGRAPEEMIYVDVIGQGISFLRSVRAEHVARDIYRIVDVMPADETWRYEPGQTVRCRKKKLSSGKALVAFEEIILQRAN